MSTARTVFLALGTMLLLASGASRAQQSQTVIDQQQTPNRSAIPEKIGPPIEVKKPTAPEEKAAPGNEGRQLPDPPSLDMKDTVPNTGGVSPVPPAKPEAQ
jgi:hypothetical protein